MMSTRAMSVCVCVYVRVGVCVCERVLGGA